MRAREPMEHLRMEQQRLQQHRQDRTRHTNGARRSRGLTLIELLVTVAVSFVLIGVAGPMFVGFVAERGIVAKQNEFIAAVNFARSEATRRQSQVTVQAFDASDSADEWGAGWCVTAGDPGDCNAPIMLFPPARDGTLDALGALDGEDGMSFDGRGVLDLAGAGVFKLCDGAGPHGRQLVVSPIGRIAGQVATCP